MWIGTAWTATDTDGYEYEAAVGDRRLRADGSASWAWRLSVNGLTVESSDDDRIGSPSFASERSVLESLASFLDSWLSADPDSEEADSFPESARFFEDVIEEFVLDMNESDD
jgi:hypothetical protein